MAYLLMRAFRRLAGAHPVRRGDLRHDPPQAPEKLGALVKIGFQQLKLAFSFGCP